MKNYKFLFISALFLSIALNSCKEDYLDTKPTGSVDAGSAYATTKNAKAAINGIYRAMMVRYQGSQGHSGYPALMIINDVMVSNAGLRTAVKPIQCRSCLMRCTTA